MYGVSSGPRNLAAALRDLHGSTTTKVRVSAAADLARHAEAHPEEVTEGLIAALEDAATAVRAAAAVALADSQIDNDEVVEALLLSLREDNDEVRQMVLVALGEMTPPAALDEVERALQDPVPQIRFQAVIAFPRLCANHDRVIKALLAASRDEDAMVRHIALRMAEEVGEPGLATDDENAAVDPRLLKRATALLGDEDAMVRVTSAVILGRCGRLDGADVLVEVAARKQRTDSLEDEGAAIELCGELGLRAAIKPLRRRAFGGVPLLRRDPFVWQARVALAALGHQGAIAWVLSGLRSWSRERRCLAVAAAMRAHVLEAEPLIHAMQGQPRRADQQLVSEALETLAAERKQHE